MFRPHDHVRLVESSMVAQVFLDDDISTDKFSVIMYDDQS
jgi:hypothetical protein